MPKVLFLTLHRLDRSPSQRFRFEQYLDYLESNGIQWKHSYLLNKTDDKIFYSKGNILKKTIILFKSIGLRLYQVIFEKTDIVFVQREAFMLGSSFFEKFFSEKFKLIYDFDDSIWIKQVSDANRSFSFLKSSDKIKKIISIADLVITGNDYLAEYSFNFNNNVIIIPTTIDTSIYYPIEKNNCDKICIGWSGSFSTIEHFKNILPVLEILKANYNEKIFFKVIGDADFKYDKLNIVGKAWDKNTELDELREFDIGIMPLQQDEWAQGKCGLKGLQYMSLEIPTVMTRVGVNKKIINENVNGFLADSEQEWLTILSSLIEDPELRKNIGKEGRKTVVEKYSVEANKHKYLKAIKSVL